MPPTLGLQSLIRQARDELEEIDREARVSAGGPRFFVGRITIEAKVVIEEVDKASGGFDLKVVTFGKGVDASQQQVHTVTVELRPMHDLPDEADRSVIATAEAEDGEEL